MMTSWNIGQISASNANNKPSQDILLNIATQNTVQKCGECLRKIQLAIYENLLEMLPIFIGHNGSDKDVSMRNWVTNFSALLIINCYSFQNLGNTVIWKNGMPVLIYQFIVRKLH